MFDISSIKSVFVLLAHYLLVIGWLVFNFFKSHHNERDLYCQQVILCRYLLNSQVITNPYRIMLVYRSISSNLVLLPYIFLAPPHTLSREQQPACLFLPVGVFEGKMSLSTPHTEKCSQRSDPEVNLPPLTTVIPLNN